MEAAAVRGAVLRLMGGIAVRSRCPGQADVLRRFGRRYNDVDLVGYGRHADAIRESLAGLGFAETAHVYVDSGGTRMVAQHPLSHTNVDVFLDRLDFCHTIPLKKRLELDPSTLPLAELLLQKLQIVEINQKDLVDIVVLLLGHPLARDDRGAVNADRIALLTASDWGLWRTVTMNLGKTVQFAAGGELNTTERDAVSARAAELGRWIESHPKSLSWKMRSRVGDRVKWYSDVEELHPVGHPPGETGQP